MEFQHTETFNFQGAFRGMRNPMESWSKSDSGWGFIDSEFDEGFTLGRSDISLAQKLIKAGSEHRKFMRQIFVCTDITAPLYWWKEFDTYKVGTSANSTSTMHKLYSTPITPECFALDSVIEMFSDTTLTVSEAVCNLLENYRQEYLRSNDKRVWRALVQLLPSSWLQIRTATMNYESILSMVKQRENHKLKEWSEDFMNWAADLPYAKELIFID